MEKNNNVIIMIEPHTILKLIKCNVLVAEIVNKDDKEKVITVTREFIGGHRLYTYTPNTYAQIELVITFDSVSLLEIKE